MSGKKLIRKERPLKVCIRDLTWSLKKMGGKSGLSTTAGILQAKEEGIKQKTKGRRNVSPVKPFVRRDKGRKTAR